MEKTILIVDDEAPIRKLLSKAFSQSGFNVVTAENGESALELLSGKSVQVMFLDLRLPGMNGIDLCREIRKDNPIACIYAMTGYGSLFELSDARDAGFDDYFMKPIDISMFIKTAEEAFGKIDRWRKK